MKIVDIKQFWKGFFIYMHGYDLVDTYIKVVFQMDLILDGNSFTGASTDSLKQKTLPFDSVFFII